MKCRKESKMPALNFKKQFAQLVESSEKRQTIRALRKDGKNPKPGQTLYFYTGQRTKACRKLGEAICKSVEQICINGSRDISVASTDLSTKEELALIKADGFENINQFYEFFENTHGLPFFGLLIKW